MNTVTINFVRKYNGVNYADASITIESKNLSSINEIINAIKSAVTTWIDTTTEGQDILNYSGGIPNIADISQDIQKNPTLKALLKTKDIVLKSIRTNHDDEVSNINAVDYDLSMYNTEQSVTICSNCNADLKERDAINREYVHKDGDESQHCTGFYKQDSSGEFRFEPSASVNLSGGRYDLLDDSDKCANCDHQL